MEVNLRKFATDTEVFFNVINSIPGVAIPGSLARILMGKTQMTFGLCFSALGLAGQVVHPRERQWEVLQKEGMEHSIQGALNTLRGFGELSLGYTFVGSCIPFTYQMISSNGFQPIVKYGSSPKFSVRIDFT